MGRLTDHALEQYLGSASSSKARSDGGKMQAVDMLGQDQGDKLFYKLANLDDRIKNADQVRPVESEGV